MKRLFLLGILSAALSVPAVAAPSAAASISPLHSILANIMDGGGDADILIPPDQSPHHARLSPSQALRLQNTDAVFYMDESFEPFLRSVWDSLPENVRQVGILSRMDRKPCAHDDHDDHAEHDDADKHDEHDHDDHAEHDDADKHDEHDHDDHAEHDDADKHDEHDHDEHDEHGHDDHAKHDDDCVNSDPHVWLDTGLAREIARIMAQELSEIDPQERKRYQDNLKKFEKQLTDLDAELTAMLANAGLPFMTMHDAYQGFSTRYKLNNIGAILDAHAHQISAKDIRRTRQLLGKAGRVCLFVEPQLSERAVATISEGLDVTVARVDILGTDFTAGKASYFDTMRGVGRSFARCLTP